MLYFFMHSSEHTGLASPTVGNNPWFSGISFWHWPHFSADGGLGGDAGCGGGDGSGGFDCICLLLKFLKHVSEHKNRVFPLKRTWNFNPFF